MRRFILGFLRKHPRFQNNDIYLFGESYAGHYVPATARIILEHNKKSSDDERVNLKAIGVGVRTLAFAFRSFSAWCPSVCLFLHPRPLFFASD